MSFQLAKTFECISFKDTFQKVWKGEISVKNTRKESKDIECDENVELLELIKNTKDAWKSSIINYDYTTESDMLDYYAYQIKAHELRFEYLLKKAKEKGVRAKLFNGI